MNPAQRARLDIREKRHTGTTRGLAPGYVQCNLAVVPRALAFDFLLYCQRNSRACPVLEVCDPGSWEPKQLAPSADLRTDLPKYCIFEEGKSREATDAKAAWRNDLVAFLIGSGLTFDGAFERAGVPTDRHRWVVNSSIPTVPAGPFHGDMVVTMRWLTPQQAIVATQVSSRFPHNHGAPIHVGDPATIGVRMENALYGGTIPAIPPGLVPVFWACGVTPQEAALRARVELMITHAPAHGFVTDLEADRFCLP
ncbi:MAG: DUF1445 domain-containing protein [Betaproteobacteria bacterium]|nr:DUF1445 domain-containing protein [Betaproteobacteria bacterium]